MTLLAFILQLTGHKPAVNPEFVLHITRYSRNADGSYTETDVK